MSLSHLISYPVDPMMNRPPIATNVSMLRTYVCKEPYKPYDIKLISRSCCYLLLWTDGWTDSSMDRQTDRLIIPPPPSSLPFPSLPLPSPPFPCPLSPLQEKRQKERKKDSSSSSRAADVPHPDLGPEDRAGHSRPSAFFLSLSLSFVSIPRMRNEDSSFKRISGK